MEIDELKRLVSAIKNLEFQKLEVDGVNYGVPEIVLKITFHVPEPVHIQESYNEYFDVTWAKETTKKILKRILYKELSEWRNFYREIIELFQNSEF